MQSKWLVSQRRHTFILIRLLIENQHMSQYSRENLITPDIWLSLKAGSSTPTCTDTRKKNNKTQREAEPHFGGFSSHVLPFRRGAWWTPVPWTRVKVTIAAGVGHVQLNFLTAGRDQRWKIISCSGTRPASIIQRCVLLGDLIFFPSQSCPSSASANRSLPSFLTRKDFSRTEKKWDSGFFFKVLELFSLLL